MRFVCIVIALSAFIACYRSPEPGSVDARRLADSVARQVAAHDLGRAVEALHYPDDEPAGARRKDAAGVQRSLDVLFEDFGSVSNLSPVDSVPPTYENIVGGGTVEFWARHPTRTRYFYSVRFAKRGPGWIFVDVSSIEGRIGVRSLSFALPQSPSNRMAAESTMARLLSAIGSGG